MVDLFDKAYAAARNPDHKNRINYARLHCDFLGLSATYDDYYVNGTDAQKANYKGSITNFVGFRISDIIPPAHIEQL